MAAPQGNSNYRKGRPINEMLYRICLQEDWTRLRKALEKQLDKAAEGDPAAISFCADRLEGRPAQALDIGGQEDNPLRITGGIDLVRPKD